MKYFGLDYGTTNSLLYGYSDGHLYKTPRIPSAVVVSNGSVVKTGFDALDDRNRSGSLEKTPKRHIYNLDDYRANGVSCRKMISAILCELLRSGDFEQDSHITLTVPNAYKSLQYSYMRDILCTCLKEVFGENHKMQIHLVPEPVAAALFYVHKHIQELPDVCRLVVCDIGGGTTDMCIVEVKKHNRALSFEIKDGMQHDEDLGGEKFEERICQNMPIPNGLDEKEWNNTVQALKEGVSGEEEFPLLLQDGSEVCLSRMDFISYIWDYLSELEEMMSIMLKKSGMRPDNTWYILPVGGSCMIPAIRERLAKVFVGAHLTSEDEITIFDSVAQGAAIYSAWHDQALGTENYNDISIQHRTPHEIEICTANESWRCIVPQNASDGPYPINVKLVDPIIKDGKYSLGMIKLQEGGRRSYEWPHDSMFDLAGRDIGGITLQLGIEIKECRPCKCWLKDSAVDGNYQEWIIKQ